MAKPHPLARLKDWIEERGLSYNEFGRMIAEAEVPQRNSPYKRNNVQHWLDGTAGPRPSAWAAIEAITGHRMAYFMELDQRARVGSPPRRRTGLPLEEAKERPVGRTKRSKRKGER